MKIRARRLRSGALFKLMLRGLAAPLGIFFLVCGLAALFGAETVKWNDEQVTGLAGLLAALLLWPVFTLVGAGLLWLLVAPGLWIASLFGSVELEFVEEGDHGDHETMETMGTGNLS